MWVHEILGVNKAKKKHYPPSPPPTLSLSVKQEKQKKVGERRREVEGAMEKRNKINHLPQQLSYFRDIPYSLLRRVCVCVCVCLSECVFVCTFHQ